MGVFDGKKFLNARSVDLAGKARQWRAGVRARPLRVFFSHRYDYGVALYQAVIAGLQSQFSIVEDLSLTEDQQLTGPRGGMVNDYVVAQEVASRIFTSDIVIASARVASGRSEWVVFEVELAAIAYSIPVLFIEEPGTQRYTSMVQKLQHLGAKCEVAEIIPEPTGYRQTETTKIIAAIARLVKPPVFRAPIAPGVVKDMRTAWRGPGARRLEGVMRHWPYKALETPFESKLSGDSRDLSCTLADDDAFDRGFVHD